jgi:hypothetical protein
MGIENALFNVDKIKRSVHKFLRKNLWKIRKSYQVRNTGTYYIHATRWRTDILIRVSDHKGYDRWFLKLSGLPEPSFDVNPHGQSLESFKATMKRLYNERREYEQ